MNPVPQSARDDGVVLAGIGGALVHGLADIDPVAEELIEHALVDRLTGAGCHPFGGQAA